MKLDIRAAERNQPVTFHHEMDFSDLLFFDRVTYPSPILIEGSVTKSAGILTLNAVWRTVLSLCCDRCGVEFSQSAEDDLSVTLVTEAPREDRDDFFVAEQGFCDLDELFRPIFILLPPQKTLCREDCAGLCSHCGQNLNIQSCPCHSREIDPRLAVLQSLLDDGSQQ